MLKAYLEDFAWTCEKLDPSDVSAMRHATDRRSKALVETFDRFANVACNYEPLSQEGLDRYDFFIVRGEQKTVLTATNTMKYNELCRTVTREASFVNLQITLKPTSPMKSCARKMRRTFYHLIF